MAKGPFTTHLSVEEAKSAIGEYPYIYLLRTALNMI